MAAEPNTLPAVPEQQNGMVAMMERLAMNPDLPVEKLRELLTMQMEIRADEARREFAAAMARVQAALPRVIVTKDNTQTNSKYAPLEVIIKVASPIYTAEGFSLSFSEAASPKPDHIRVVGILRHASGHSSEHYRDVAVDTAGIAGKVNKTLTHGEASSATYGRRYVTCLAFNIPTGDDNDGNQPPKGESISDEQAANIEALITEVGADRARFLEWAQVDKVDLIPKKFYNTAVRQLQKKRSAK